MIWAVELIRLTFVRRQDIAAGTEGGRPISSFASSVHVSFIRDGTFLPGATSKGIIKGCERYHAVNASRVVHMNALALTSVRTNIAREVALD